MIEGLRNFIHQEVQRFLDRRMRKTPCQVTGYRGDIHAVKVMYRPSQTLSGWVQIETDQVGSLIAPNIGDPGWIDFHEDDRRAPVFVGSNHNDLFPPAQQINAGERFFRVFGSTFYQKNDGSVEISDSGGATWVLRDGAITSTDKVGTIIATDGAGNANVTAMTAVTVNAPAINLGSGGTLQPVKLADNSDSTVVKAQ
jgi:uncharacterized protein involved in type VI secretion and phage assembly